METPQLACDQPCDSLQTGACGVVDGDIFLAGRDGHMPKQVSGHWKWLCFTLKNPPNKPLAFRINDQFEPGTERLDAHRMLFQAVQDAQPTNHENWRPFDWHEHDAASGEYRFGLNQVCPFPKIRVAYGIPYAPDDVWYWIDQLDQTGLVKPLLPEVDRYTIGHSAPATDDLGRDWPALPVPGFRLGKGAKRIVLLAGVHPNEGPANLVLEGCVDALIASKALRNLTVDVYPMVNPAGRAAGLNRTTLDKPDRDSNRVWRPDLYEDMPEIKCVAETVPQALSGQQPDVFIDFHSWCDPREQPFGILSHADGFHRHSFWRRLTELEPRLGVMDSGWSNPSTETWAYRTLQAKFCMTFESTFRGDWLAPQLKTLGRQVARALTETPQD